MWSFLLHHLPYRAEKNITHDCKGEKLQMPPMISGPSGGEQPTKNAIIVYELLIKDDKKDLSQLRHDVDSMFCNVFSHRAEIPNGCIPVFPFHKYPFFSDLCFAMAALPLVIVEVENDPVVFEGKKSWSNFQLPRCWEEEYVIITPRK